MFYKNGYPHTEEGDQTLSQIKKKKISSNWVKHLKVRAEILRLLGKKKKHSKNTSGPLGWITIACISAPNPSKQKQIKDTQILSN